LTRWIAAPGSTATANASRGSSEKPASGAGGCGRESEHEKVAEPKPKTPDVDLGMSRPPSRFRSNNAGYASRELPQPTLHPPGGS